MSPERNDKPQVEVFPAMADDLRPLVDIEEAVSMQKYPNVGLGIAPEDIAAIGWGDERAAKYRERFLENSDASIWVAKENGVIIGFTAATKGEDGYWIRKLYVASGRQNEGAGSKLLAQAEAWLGTGNDIQLGIASYDDAALQFYTKHGYEPVGLRPEEQTTVHATGKVIHETLLVKHPA